MSRSGVEPKPPWGAVPAEVRAAVDESLGGLVQRGMRVWGGYTPTPTFRLRLTDGRRAFFKAVNPESNAFARAAHAREVRVYQELYGLIADWAPDFYGAFECGEWSVILLEDLGPKSAPPWSPGLARRVAQAFSRFHASTLGQPLPSWLPQSNQHALGLARLWYTARDPDWLESVAGLAHGRENEAFHWLEAAVPVLAAASTGLVEAGPPFALLHEDTRSDNLRWTRGRLYLFDWPHVSVGRVEDDAAIFAQSVTAEGGPEPEEVIAWYAQGMPLQREVLDAAVASLAGYFADGAWQDDIPGLPRLRAFHRQQLRVTLDWASRRLALPHPSWIEAIR